jgi:hypothetical protein
MEALLPGLLRRATKVGPALDSCENRGRSGGITLNREEGELRVDFTILGISRNSNNPSTIH